MFHEVVSLGGSLPFFRNCIWKLER
nr:RAxF-45 family protein [Neobacillus bataviensis]